MRTFDSLMDFAQSALFLDFSLQELLLLLLLLLLLPLSRVFKFTCLKQNIFLGCKVLQSYNFHCTTTPSGPRPPHYSDFTITLRNTTLDRTPLDEYSDRQRDVYLTTHNTHNKQTSISTVGFEPAIPASEQPQTCITQRVHWDWRSYSIVTNYGSCSVISHVQLLYIYVVHCYY
jgi:hypothetical protein